jgi:hypothetical protein
VSVPVCRVKCDLLATRRHVAGIRAELARVETGRSAGRWHEPSNAQASRRAGGTFCRCGDHAPRGAELSAVLAGEELRCAAGSTPKTDGNPMEPTTVGQRQTL